MQKTQAVILKSVWIENIRWSKMCGNMNSKPRFWCVVQIYVATHFLMRENLERSSVYVDRKNKLQKERRSKGEENHNFTYVDSYVFVCCWM